MEFLTKTQKALLDLLANALFSAGRKIDFNSLDLPGLWYEAYIQTVSLVAFSGTAPENCDEAQLSAIRKKLNESLTSSLKVNKAHARLHKILNEAHIPYVIIKGYSAALYYKDPLLRSMGDVDFLVSEKYFEKAESVLEKAGFIKGESDHLCHLVYMNKGVRFEMHTEPAGIPKGEAGIKVKKHFDNIFETSREVTTAFGVMRVPSEFHHGLIILLHTVHHLTSEGVGIRHLCDWATFASHFTKEEFCNILEAELKEIGLWNFAKLITNISIDYLGCPIENIDNDIDKELADEIAEDILKSGNLGQKNVDRGHEGLLIGGNGKYETEEVSMLKQFFISADNIVYNNWRASRKFKILLPFGWLFFGGRYILRSVFGKRPKIRPKNIAREATSRKNLYKRLNLFTEEK